MKRTTAIILSAAVLATGSLAACSRTTAVKTTDQSYQSTNWRNVQILTTQPSRPYTELGTLNTSGWKQKDTKKLYEEFRKEGAKWGADAVLITSTGVSGMKDEQWKEAVAIRFTDDASNQDDE